MYSNSGDRAIMLSSNVDETFDKTFQNFIKRRDEINEDMEESRFTFKMSAVLTLGLRK